MLTSGDKTYYASSDAAAGAYGGAQAQSSGAVPPGATSVGGIPVAVPVQAVPVQPAQRVVYVS